MQNRTPLTLITGSLGSGKTTLLKRIIRFSESKLAVLINEFGEIGIDGRIIKGEHTRLIELAGGCVCCELTGEFVAAVNELLDKYQPDMIVLEATGVAEADALVYEVEEDLPRVRLDCVICIVDGWAGSRYPQVGYVGRVQLQQADIIHQQVGSDYSRPDRRGHSAGPHLQPDSVHHCHRTLCRGGILAFYRARRQGKAPCCRCRSFACCTPAIFFLHLGSPAECSRLFRLGGRLDAGSVSGQGFCGAGFARLSFQFRRRSLVTGGIRRPVHATGFYRPRPQ